MLIDSSSRYGIVSRSLHWGMAILVLWQMMKFFDRVKDGEHWVGQVLVPWHVSIGSVFFIIVLFRLFWSIKQKSNRPEPDPAAALMVKAGHGLLYLCMLLMPITGIMTMLGNGYGLTVFGFSLASKGEGVEWMASLGSLHSPIAWIMLIMVLGHAGMALLHHFVKKDNTLRRML